MDLTVKPWAGVVWFRPKPVPWSWLYGFIAYVLIIASIGGFVFWLADLGEALR
jgi:ABC-type polysaccharide/polyol phosphate export permease